MSIDWNEIEKLDFAQIRTYVEKGKFTTTLKEVEAKAPTASGSVPINFIFKDVTEGVLPKATHWFSVKNQNWRAWHFRKLMELLGASETDAKKAVSACEDQPTDEKKVALYVQTFNRLAAKKVKVEVEVWQEPATNGRTYGRADFTNNLVRMSYPEDTTKSNNNTDVDTLTEMNAAEDETIDLGEIPF